MSSKKNRRGVSRLGKNALEIFQPAPSVAPAPTPQPEPVSAEKQEAESSLLDWNPALAWGLWWQEMCYLRTQQLCRYWWPELK